MNKKYLVLVLVIIFLGLVFPELVYLFTDWLWFKQVGFENIFTTILGTKISLGLGIGLISFGLIYLNLKLAAYLIRDKEIPIQWGERGETIDLKQYLGKINFWFSSIFGLFATLIGGSYWETWLKFLNQTPFNLSDPIFGRDLSFYFFTWPMLKVILGFSLVIFIFSLIGCGLIYLGARIFSFPGQKPIPIRYSSEGKPIQAKGPYLHFSLLVAVLFLILAARTYWIKIPNLLYSTTGPFTGASFTDLRVTLPVLKVLTLVLIIVAGIAFLSIFRKNYKLLGGAIGVYLTILILGTWLAPALFQKWVVEPNELAKETPYLKNNISFTLKAFNLHQVKERDLKAKRVLTQKDIQTNQATIRNIRVWDREPLLDTFGQLQEIRTYYDFGSIDNDRYFIDSQYRQVLLSPRELNSQNLPHPTFINKHLTFTHGYGLTLAPVNEVTQEGLPALVIKDLPPQSITSSLKVTRPEIYFGELTKPYVIVNTQNEEFDYPSGEENVFTHYKGRGGIKIDSWGKKFLMAMRFGNLKILFSEDITDHSRIMYYRNIYQRVKKIAPFLKLDSDPYLVITKHGFLKWIQDAYTTSGFYPYSKKIRAFGQNLNYIRNSVKIVIDPYQGKVQFYVTDPQDPLIQTYAKIFKGNFLPLSKMPEDLKPHLRYPENIFSLQIAVYTIYHMEHPRVFYNKEDQWEVPVISEQRRDTMMRRIIMKLPGKEKEEYILMIPFIPQGKDNLRAWMVARSDGENYGKLAVYRFPKQKLVFGPQQVINRINQDPQISKQISLWDQRGSEVNQGPLLVIPIEQSLLYIRPLYLRGTGGKLPELKRVIVVYKKKIAMEESVPEALDQIFGEKKEKPEKKTEIEKKGKEITPPSKQNLISQALKYYQKAIQAQKKGNWAKYGKEIEKLGQILEKLTETNP